MISPELLTLLRCPLDPSHSRLEQSGDGLACQRCRLVFPVREGTALPPVFTKFADVAPDPLSLPAADIGRNRDQWIEQWNTTVLR